MTMRLMLVSLAPCFAGYCCCTRTSRRQEETGLSHSLDVLALHFW